MLSWSATAGAQPKPQYTVEDVAKSFVGTAPSDKGDDSEAVAAPAGAAGACESKGKVTGPDGLCYPANQSTAGFNLGRRVGQSAAARTVARPAPSPSRGAPVQLAHAFIQRDLQITFRAGSADLTDQGRANAEVFAKALKTVPQLADTHFELAGYTDSSGRRDKNIALSQQRADAVKAFLVGLGVDSARLAAQGYGATNFLPGMSSTASDNRRVVATKE